MLSFTFLESIFSMFSKALPSSLSQNAHSVTETVKGLATCIENNADTSECSIYDKTLR